MSALDLILATESDREMGKLARAELAQLRAAEIRTMEHCNVCGSLLALDADAPEESEPFCPYCEYQETIIMISEREKTIESLRSDLQAAQERIAEQARQLAEARVFAEYVLRRSLWTESTLSHSAVIWLAANPAPSVEQP